MSLSSIEAITDRRNEETENSRLMKGLVTKSRITNIVHLFTIIFVVLIVYLALKEEFVFFTWHPLLMSTGWILLLTEGVLTLNKNNNLLKDFIGSNRIIFHWILQTSGLLLVILGFFVAFKSKNDKHKSHFKSWHALFGLLGVICAVLSGLSGIFTLYYKELKNLYSPKLNKFIHILLGSQALIYGGCSAVLSVYTKWFARRTSSNDWIFIPTLLLIASVVIWTSIRPGISISKRFKILISS